MRKLTPSLALLLLPLLPSCNNSSGPLSPPLYYPDATASGHIADAGAPGVDANLLASDADITTLADSGIMRPSDSGITPTDTGTIQDAWVSAADTGGTATDSGASDDTGVTSSDTGTSVDATAPDNDAGTAADTGINPTDAGSTGTDDGAPTRMQCTGNFGGGLTAGFGRMDGYLVSVLAPGGSRTCNGDASHVHLQVLIQGSVYDVAVNTDTYELERDMTLPDGAWSEGWHSGVTLDYVQLGLHSTDFMPVTNAAQSIEDFVQSANHISVFGTGYGPTGAHDIHRHNGGDDGAIIIEPLSPTPHVMFFCFNNQTF